MGLPFPELEYSESASALHVLDGRVVHMAVEVAGMPHIQELPCPVNGGFALNAPPCAFQLPQSLESGVNLDQSALSEMRSLRFVLVVRW